MRMVLLYRDLRSVDNRALDYAIDGETEVVTAFCSTPKQWLQHHLSPMQADLIFRRLNSLSDELRNLNIPLLYHECDDFTAANQWLVKKALELGVNEVVLNKNYEVNERQREETLEQALTEVGITLTSIDDKCAVPPGSVVNKQGAYYKVFTPFKKAWLALGYTPQVVPSRASVPVKQPLSDCFTDKVTYSYPRQDSRLWPVDSTAILQRLRAFSAARVDDYQRQRDFPAVDGTSQLSPYLAIGALSVRQCIARLYYDQPSASLSEGAVVWLSELIWREFYQHLVYFEPKLCKGEGYLDWEKHLDWSIGSEVTFEHWCRGDTGYPIVDAAMKQLNQTGWMHNRLRMIVASFLTKDLQIDWRKGERYFMTKLVDGDFASNNGGWQWCASTGCDGQPYFRIFNPITQGEKFDTKGDFIRHWLPELAEVPERYIHKPWAWQGFENLQYVAPIVDHKTQREITLQLYKNAKDRH
ncbi:deoxyribodipyrimidine photo-lyase [Vibrio hippocampi]|uniref:Deoxyribodipyrimidine photo-lyase n=1 Tax=Vibrio hippocampi TaxID=654686 RepID=A0ABN8DMM3_9VIBR|nr:deoxyribodipyrimidine photo-lyase [Vibrio hippocampi]CAH0530148.1 Deoxyribodipyrimidine photo-lyase [Vibrio hippocampi]